MHAAEYFIEARELGEMMQQSVLQGMSAEKIFSDLELPVDLLINSLGIS